MDIYGLIGGILIIAVLCSLFDINEKFLKLLYVLGAVLVVAVILSFFGIMPNHLQVR